MRNVSFAQALVVLGCFAAIGVAHFLGPYEGTVVSVACAYLLWMKQPPSGPTPPAVKALAGVFVGLMLGHFVACVPGQVTTKDATELIDKGAEHAHCQELGREAPDGSNVHVYNLCEKEAGL